MNTTFAHRHWSLAAIENELRLFGALLRVAAIIRAVAAIEYFIRASQEE